MLVTEGGIPKIIHQTYKSFDTIPEVWKETPGKWQESHVPFGWKYVFWDDESIEYYMRTYHPEFMDVWNAFEYKIQKIDAFRYFVLYDIGGVYSDMDIQPLKCVEDYLGAKVDAYVVKSANHPCYTNAFMVARKGSLVMKEMFERMKERLPWYAFGPHLKVMLTTGPLAFTDAVNRCSASVVALPPCKFNATDITQIEEGVVDNTAILRSLPGGSWHQADSVIYNFFFKYRWTLVIILAIVVIIIVVVWVWKWLRRRSGSRCRSDSKTKNLPEK